MPTRSSSPVLAGLSRFTTAPPPAPDEHPSLLERLAAVPDPRRSAGRRHPLTFVLALAACAVLAGAKSLAAVAEWVADAPSAVLTTLGAPVREPTAPVAPAEATVRRLLQRVDGDALDAAVGGWLADREQQPPPPGSAPDQRPPLRTLAIDGKTVRGARRKDGTQVHLPAAMTAGGNVIAQREVGSNSNESLHPASGRWHRRENGVGW